MHVGMPTLQKLASYHSQLLDPFAVLCSAVPMPMTLTFVVVILHNYFFFIPLDCLSYPPTILTWLFAAP